MWKKWSQLTATWSKVPPISSAHSSNSWSVTPDPNTWPGGHSVSLPMSIFLIWVMLKMECSWKVSPRKVLSSLFKSPPPPPSVAPPLVLLVEFERLRFLLPPSPVEFVRCVLPSREAMVGMREGCWEGVKVSKSMTWLVGSMLFVVDDDLVGLESDIEDDLLRARLRAVLTRSAPEMISTAYTETSN